MGLRRLTARDILRQPPGIVAAGTAAPTGPWQVSSIRTVSRALLTSILAASAVLASLWTITPIVASAASTTRTFTPAADAYVRSDKPTNNYGTSTKLIIDNAPVQHTLIRFDVSGIGGDPVEGATLRLYSGSSSGVGGVFWTTTSSTWNETSVTWNTAPAAGATPVATLGAVGRNRWYEVDLSSIVTGDGPLSLRITSTSTTAAQYTSREGSASLRPQLVVVTSPPPDITPPQVSITAPAPGEVSGSVSVAVTASDDVGVTSVGLSLDGNAFGTDASDPFGFTWDTLSAANGEHTLVATASDAAGHVSTSAPVTVTVANPIDATPPTQPTDLVATATSSTGVSLTWTASWDENSVDHYVVLRDSAPIATTLGTSHQDDTAAPDTTYGYTVVAYDATGNPSLASEPANATTPPASGPNPTTCEGYPEPRIYYETQSWWEPVPVVGGQGHIHMGICWPHGQTVSGLVRLDFRVLMHFQAGTVVRFKVQDDASISYNTDVSIPIEYASESRIEQTVYVDTTQQADGLRQWRIYVFIEHPNGNRQRTKAMYRVDVENVAGDENEIGPTYSEYGGAGWYIEADGTDWGYQTAQVVASSHLPIGACVSGVWTPSVKTSTATEHLVTVDPRFHDGYLGWIVHSSDVSGYSGPVAIDTANLTSGWHRLVVHSGTRVGEEENGGAFVYPFRVC